MIRRVDLPLDEPTDDAWALVNEGVVSPLLCGAWNGNGLRIGVLNRDQLDAYAQAMPEPLSFGESVINKSDYFIPILESSRLRRGQQFDVDLTRPPKPRATYTVSSEKSSTLRLLAKIEKDQEGQHYLVLTPHHYIPSRFDLVPRSPLAKELDGRVLEELRAKVLLTNNQVAVVGLHYPWPERWRRQAQDETESEQPSGASSTEGAELPSTLGAPDIETDTEKQTRQPAIQTSFGSTLMTGMRIRQRAQAVLLISIVVPEEDGDQTER